MNALLGAAVTSEPGARGDGEIFIHFLFYGDLTLFLFLRGKRRVNSAAPHAEMLHDT